MDEKGIDSYEARERFAVLRLLAERGGHWRPEDPRQVTSLRKDLLKLRPKFTAEFVLIMAQHRACAKETLHALLRTPTIKAHIAEYESRINKLLADWE